jgi:plasmid stabilization system protein ParE
LSSFDIEVLPEAEAEAREAFHWYFERSPIVADAFRTELFDAIDALATTAKDWPEDEDGFRRYHLKHFPYTVWYELIGQLASVFAISHQRRRPGYWQDR